MGTTAEKLTYLNTTKQKIKDGINNIGGNITSETTFREYVTELNNIYELLPKISGTGTSLSLSPTLKGKLKTTLKGNTSQVQLSGKNLLDDTQWVQNRVINNTSGDITYSQNNASSEQYMAVQPNTTYTFSSALSCRALRVGTYKSDKTFIERKSSSANVSTWTFTTDANTYYLRWNINYNDTTITQDNIDALQLQINSGNERGTYEQYCGGTPSPNPSYPQDIHNVSGNNTIYVRNKNLKSEGTIYAMYFNATTFSNGNRTLCIPIEANTTYYIKKSIVSNRFRVCLSNAVPRTSTSVYEYQDVSSLTETSITNTNYAYLNIFFYQTNETYTEQELYDCLNIYTQETTYPINLPSGMELCKIGTYQDYIYKDSDKWYLHKEIGKATFNGTENWATSGAVVPSGVSAYSNNTNSGFISNTQGYSNLFTIIDNATDWNVPSGNGTARYTSNQLYIKILTSIASDVNTLKTWLGNNNITMYGILSTPTYTKITDTTLLSQLEAIYNAKSKNGTTNINQENNDLPFILDVSCLKGA